MNETKASSLPGIPLAVLFVLLFVGSAALFFHGGANQIPAVIATGVVVFVIVAFLCKGFFQVQPNQGMVLLLFGRYAGTARETGLRWTNPFLTKRAVSLRVRNFESSKLKVNDADGNPIEIAAVIVWQVVDTAEAVFQVDDYENYVH
ncbi:MAG: SPFH domain-containing protein, partial [Xanthomonadaceae bacterium]|nr:SPFH domain-containing protein [Xanthomonadaceae bacterium]